MVAAIRSGQFAIRWVITLLLVLFAVQPGVRAAEDKKPELYRLRAGDQLGVSVTPQKAYDCTGVVLPDGMLYLKNITGFRAVGLTLPDVETHVRKVLSEKLVSPKISVTLLQIAPATAAVQGTVTITGAVAKAGPLPLDEGLRVYKALELAGGPEKNADLKRVVIRHRDLTRTTVDLSSGERISDPLHNRLLLDGDSIEVPQQLVRSASIRGAVTRPGEVELPSGVRLWKALDLVGGSTKEADLAAIRILHADLTRTVVDLSTPEKISDPQQNIVLREGDLVEIPLLAVLPAPTVREEQVRIRGNVLNPGRYPYRSGMELIDLIEAAGKLSPAADLTRIEIQRREQVRTVDLEMQEKQGFQGKVILQPDDEVYIPGQENRVILIGAVPKYGPAALKPGQTIRQFFTEGPAEIAGAVNPAAANLKKVQIIRRGQQAIEVNLQDLILKPGNKKAQDVTLTSGDVIFIPPRQQRGSGGFLSFLSQLGPLGFLFGAF